ncbi:MAG: arylamine N-acetyltransferase, partial [Nocardia sp.]|nr:arylamine N-acetyltransferase [Nocardia sp.]
LDSLGYTVHHHVGGVYGPDGPNADVRGNHMVLTVDLPQDGGLWYVDAGLGDALYEPLPLAEGRYRQAPFDLMLESTAAGWHLVHDPRGGFAGMNWTVAEADSSLFEAKHRWLSTSPESGFVQVAMAERRDATGVDVIRGLVLSRIGEGARTDEPVTDRKAWFDLLADAFDLRLRSLAPELRDRLWTTVVAAHRRWEQERAAAT